MKDFLARLMSYKTTVIGVATAVIALLALFGIIKPENKEDLAANVTNLWDAVIQVLAVISGIILMFSYDAPPKE